DRISISSLFEFRSSLVSRTVRRQIDKPHEVFVCQSPRAAPVGSSMMLSQPMSGTSIESFTILAPSEAAFFVAAPMSSTRTYDNQKEGMPGIGFLSNP